MKDRIRQLRKSLGLTQTEFAEKLGFTMVFICQVETGAKIPSERTIADIARVFNVNVEWIKTGEGEMKKEIPKEEVIASFIGDILKEDNSDGLKEYKLKIFSMLAQLPVEDWERIRKFTYSLIQENEKETDK